jgi:acetolactate synthase regulatory subunit
MQQSVTRREPPVDHRADYSVDVQCFDDVAKVVLMLRGRRYEVTRLAATRCQPDTGPWTVEFTVAAQPAACPLLMQRLQRLVGVVAARRS